MKYRLAFSPRAATFTLVAALGAFAPFSTLVVQAAPKPQLQIWPDRRVLLVLPLQVSITWNADAQLGQAILPLAQPQLQQALTSTGKFSVTLPYRFDPILRRGLAEKQLAEAEIDELLKAPTLLTAAPITGKLKFDQPVMTTEVFLEEITVGGTTQKPTVQLQVSGKLYQQGDPNPIKSETYRSAAVGGKTSGERVIAAARDAFKGLAAIFVEPPAAFDLSTAISSGATKSGQKTNGTPDTGTSTTPPEGTMVAPAPLPSTATPNSLPSTPGAPLVPQLPAAQPPLGVTAGEETTTGR